MAWTTVAELPEERAAAKPERSREFRAVRRPGASAATIERVLVCASGVHVVTSAGGAIAGRPDSPEVRDAVESAHAVAALLPARYRGRVRPVLCCRVDGPLADLVDGALVTSPVTFDHIARSTPAVLSTSEVQQVVRRLEETLEPCPVAPAGGGAWGWLGRFVVSGLAGGSAASLALWVTGQGGLTLPW